jgi:non-specific serine/threonine protein kinase
LWEVQQIIGEGWIIASRDTVGLIAEGAGQPNGRVIWLDVARFESLITESRLQKDASLRVQLLADSVKLYRDHFLAGFVLKNSPHFNEWAFAQSDNWRHQLAAALTMLSDDYCSLGQAERAIPYTKRLVALDPLNEASHLQLMQIYIQAGQQTAALKQYQTCEQILRKELDVDPQPETRALYKQIRKGEIKSIQPGRQKELGLPRHNLPFQISKFIGRERELEEVTDLIADHRLITLAGTGGIGKTRLSLKVGEQLIKDYADGVWFAELASISDPALVPQTVAKLFNVVEQAEESLTDKLIRVLRVKTVLLILDNCEHLLDACAHLADALLRNCPSLKILVTSREPLGITGEARYHVPPLGLPDLRQILEKTLGYESVQLFDERARLVQEHFSLTMENASSVTHICHRLDGIPLAIELAAARVDAFSTEQIAARLEESFNLLTSGSRTARPRQQTLRASIDWSWDLLSESEQALLRRLAVFAGGWTLDAAEAVCSGDGLEPRRAFELMTQLTAKSLVVINQVSGRAKRFRLLEMIREHALERLIAAGEEQRLREKHLNYYLEFSEHVEYGLMGPDQIELLARTIDERDNLRAALEYCARKGEVQAGLELSGRLRNFWEAYDMREGGRWLAEFLLNPRSKDYPLARAKALFAYGWCLQVFQRFDEARLAGEEALELCRANGDPYGEIDSLNLLGGISENGERRAEYCHEALTLARSLNDLMRQTTALQLLGWDHRDYQRAFAYWEEAIVLYRQIGGWRFLAHVLSMLGRFLVMNGNSDAAQKYLDEADQLYHKMNMNAGKTDFLLASGEIALLRGDYEQARTYFQENARIRYETGSLLDYLWSRALLANMELRAGNITEARQIFTEIAPAFNTGGARMGIVYTLEGLSSLNVIIGKPEHAARLAGWTDMMRTEIGNTRLALEQAYMDHNIAAAVSRMGRKAFDEAYQQGRAMTLDGAVAYALDAG